MTLCALSEQTQDWQALSQTGARSSLDNRPEPARQPRNDILISVLLYKVQHRVIIVATSKEKNYIPDQI